MSLAPGQESIASKDEMIGRHDAIKVAIRFKTSAYEVSPVCNLTCEGCLYFSGDYSSQHQERVELADWTKLFAAERSRGVNFCLLSGAEPALRPDRLRAAQEIFPAGLIYTNGTIRITPDVRFRLIISLWGDETTSKLTRGASAIDKALRNYGGDSRALFLYTINRINIDEIESTVRKCRDAGSRITFQYFSPTDQYSALGGALDSSLEDYHRMKVAGQDIQLRPEDFAAAHAAIKTAMNRYPETVMYSLVYDKWIVNGKDAPYVLDRQGVAKNCASAATEAFRLFHVNQSESTLKCGHPNVDCSQCRTLPSGMSNFLFDNRPGSSSAGGVSWSEWMEVFEFWSSFFLGDQAPLFKRLVTSEDK